MAFSDWGLLVVLLLASFSLFMTVATHVSVMKVRARAPKNGPTPPISVLKPLCGVDEGLYENLVSLAKQDYPDYELVLGAEREPRLEMRFGRIVLAVADRNGCEIGVCTGHMFLEAAAQRQLQTALELEPSGVAGRGSARRADVIECVGKDLVVTELPGELDRTLTPLDGANVL